MAASDLELVLFKDADTLVYIDPPPSKPTWTTIQPNSAELIAHRIHSHMLLKTGSPVFRKLFEPRTQSRILKRRGVPPEGIKYIIDLTPPSTEEDAVLFLTELSCPLGIRTWADAQSRWDLPPLCVGGIDMPPSPGEGQTTSPNSPLQEYSPSRHRAGIVHILQALEGITPQLNTPCKLWTFFALAKLYEIATLPEIGILILSWVYEMNNKRIIELHPEIVYRIAQGTQCGYLCRDSFSVLVGEEALLLMHQANKGIVGPKRQQASFHGRLRESLDDEELQRVEYASKSFMEYIIDRFIDLAGTEMQWLSTLSTVQIILSYKPKSPEEHETVSSLITCLKDFVRGCIVVALDEASITWLPTRHTLDSSGSYPTQSFLNVYSEMDCIERIMTRTFWKRLEARTFHESDSARLLRTKFWGTSLASLGKNIPAFGNQEDAVIRPVTGSEIHGKIRPFDLLFHRSRMGSSLPGGLQRDPQYMEGVYGGFSFPDFTEEVQSWMYSYTNQMCRPSRPEMAYELTDTLTCLSEEEFKYLPLWAGGNDDGTGGVFMDQDIPFMEAGGFSAPGPTIHTESTSSSVSSFSTVSASEFNSTICGASHRATEGHDSEVLSLNSAAFSSTSRSVKSDTEDDDDISLALSTSADEVDDFYFDADSDSDDTVVMSRHDDLEEFGDLALDDNHATTSSSEGSAT